MSEQIFNEIIFLLLSFKLPIRYFEMLFLQLLNLRLNFHIYCELSVSSQMISLSEMVIILLLLVLNEVLVLHRQLELLHILRDCGL